MALNVARVGTYAKQSGSDTINVDRMRSFGPTVTPSVNMWGIGMGWWAGRDGASSPIVTGAVYAYGSTPYDRKAITSEQSAGTSMSDASGGTRYEVTFATIDDIASLPRAAQRKLRWVAGEPRQLALLSEDFILRYSTSFPAGAFNPGVTQERGGLGSPPDSYDPTTAVTPALQNPTVYVYGYENEPPEVPIDRVPTGTVQTLTPTFTALFRDLNGAYGTSSGDGVDTGDYLQAYKIELRQVGTTTLLWNTTYNATFAESDGGTMSRVYGGSALTRGVNYEWRVRHQDTIEWGDWSGWLAVTIAARGFVTNTGTPAGKQEVNTGINFQAKWTSEQAQSTDRVQVRLITTSGTVLQTSPEIVKTVAHSAAPGTTFTITWAESAFTTLNWGTVYAYQVRGRDTSLEWSNWSTGTTFTTNYAPTIPSGLTPTGSTILTSLPKLAASFSDNDDTTGTGLTGVFRITRPNLTTVDVTPTYNATSGKWEFQTTATELSAFGTYTWVATGFDGTLYSGESTTLGGASWSNSSEFQYLAGPTVTVVAPTDGATITGSSLFVDWTVSGGTQVSYRIVLYADDTTTIVYDSGTITSTDTDFTIPSGSYRNSTAYDLVVFVTDTVPLTGSSGVIDLTIAYAPANALANVQVSVDRGATEAVDSRVHLSWDQTTYPTSGDPAWIDYLIHRTADGGPDDGITLMKRITNPEVTSFTDDTAASGYDYEYTVSQSVITGADTITSDPIGETITFAFGQNHILTLAQNPGTYRAVLTNVATKPGGRVISEAVYPGLAGEIPITIRNETYYETGTLTAAIIADDLATAKERLEALKVLDKQHGVVLIRDGAGNKLYAMISDFSWSPEMGDTAGVWYHVTLAIRQERATEGET